MATNFQEMFGVTSCEERDESDFALGFQQGTANAEKIMSLITIEFKDQSRQFREGLLEGLRDAL